ncbi:MAG: hypothetical protein HY037_06930 [Nitrospirae bacterium]|nr:hypothetical protein [Candidatus Troglogloeales bacterium]
MQIHPEILRYRPRSRRSDIWRLTVRGRACISGEDYSIRVFPVSVMGEDVFLSLPPMDVLDPLLATEIGCQLATSCETGLNVVS